MTIKFILFVGLGSCIGGCLRYIISLYIKQHVTIFPFSVVFGTLFVNIVGCFIVGCLYGLAYKNQLSLSWVIFTCTGIMGGFSTFSGFSYETIYMIMDNQILQAILYVLASIVIGFLFTWIGWTVVQ